MTEAEGQCAIRARVAECMAANERGDSGAVIALLTDPAVSLRARDANLLVKA